MGNELKLLLVSKEETLKNTIVFLLGKENIVNLINYNFNALQEKIKEKIDLLIIDTREKEGIDFYFFLKRNEKIENFPVLCITHKILTKEMAVQLMISLHDVNVSFPIDKIKFKNAYLKIKENTKKWYLMNEIKNGIKVEKNELLYQIYKLRTLKITGNISFNTENKKYLIHISDGTIDKMENKNKEETLKTLKELSEIKDGILKIEEEKTTEEKISETSTFKDTENTKRTTNIEKILEEIEKEKGVNGISILTKEGKEKYSQPEDYSITLEVKKIVPFFVNFIEKFGQKLGNYVWKGTSLTMKDKQFMLIPEKEKIVIIDTILGEPFDYYKNLLNQTEND